MGLSFDTPWALLLMVPCAIFVWWTIRHTPRLTGGRKKLAVAVRALILALLVAVASGLSPYLRMDHRAVVFVADRSASVGEEERLAGWIGEALAAKGDSDRAAVVSFGLNASVERTLSVDETDVFSLRTEVNDSFSNIAGGLQLGSGLLGEGGKIVLLSDGEENVGDLLRQGELLKNRGIAVDVVALPKRELRDAAVESLRVPADLNAGEKFSYEITVSSTFAGEAELRLYEENTEKFRSVVALETGENRFVFQDVAETPGLHRYRAEIYAAGDERGENNANYAFSRVDGLPRVLIVEGEEGTSGNMAGALEASLIPYDILLPEQLPAELADYARYDSIVLNNVPATRIAEAPMMHLGAAVRDYGIGLVMAGGSDSYGLGGYYKTEVERALPVYMDLKGKRQMPSLGLILVIDKSGSMDGGKLELAKEAALRTVELLREDDTVGVIAFDGSPWWVQEPVKLTDRDAVASVIQGIRPDGGTEIYTAVSSALSRMLEVEAQRKHIILLTDGQSAGNGSYSALTDTMNDNGITMSTVAVGNGADTALLERLAGDANGRYYFTNDQSTIPSIFSRETTLMSRTYIVEDRFVPRLGRAGDWASAFAGGVPAVDAYVATTAKETADAVLLTPMGDPLLARWQYGSGRSVAWTSDLKGEWAGEWTGWDRFPDVFAQWVKWTFPQFNGAPYDVEADWQGGEGSVTIRETTASAGSATELNAVVTGPDGERTELTPLPVAPGEYAGGLPLSGPGVYMMQIGKNGESGGTTSGFVIPYAPEYRLTEGGGEDKLRRLAELTGGRLLDAAEPGEAFAGERIAHRRTIDIDRALLVAALLLWLLDIAVRRVSLPWGRVSAWLRERLPFGRGTVAGGAGPAAADAALARLQERKGRSRASRFGGAGTGASGAPASNGSAPQPSAAGPATSGPAASPPPEPEAPASAAASGISAKSKKPSPRTEPERTPDRRTPPQAPAPDNPAAEEDAMSRLLAAKRRNRR